MPRRSPVVVNEAVAALADMQDDLPYNPTDPHNGEALTLNQSPLTLATKHMREDREFDEFARETAAENAENDLLEAATSEFPVSEDSKAYCVIWKSPTSGGKPAWTHRCTMAEWREMGQTWLAREFGAGHYEVYMYRGGNKGLYKRPTCDISAEGAVYQRKIYLRDNPQEITATPSVHGSTDRLAEVMIKGFTHMSEQIARQNQGGGEKEFLEKMLVYKQLFAPAPVAPSPDSGTAGVLDLAVKIAGMVNPSTVEKSTLETFADIAKEFMPALGAAMGNVQAVQPVSRITGPAPRPQNPEGQNVNMIQNQIVKIQLRNLIAKAEKGSDPALYADVIYDNLDNIPAEFAQRFLSDPNWLQWLASFDSRVMQHAKWFTDLYDALRRIIEDESAAETAESKNNLPQVGSEVINPANIQLAGNADNVLFGNEFGPETN